MSFDEAVANLRSLLTTDEQRAALDAVVEAASDMSDAAFQRGVDAAQSEGY